MGGEEKKGMGEGEGSEKKVKREGNPRRSRNTQKYLSISIDKQS